MKFEDYSNIQAHPGNSTISQRLADYTSIEVLTLYERVQAIDNKARWKQFPFDSSDFLAKVSIRDRLLRIAVHERKG